MRSSEGIKEKLPIKNDEESSLVAEGEFELLTLDYACNRHIKFRVRYSMELCANSVKMGKTKKG
jgi:hypothetical protein